MDRRRYLLERLQEFSVDSVDLSRIPLRIAGVRVDLVTPSAAYEARARQYFADYLASPLPGERVPEIPEIFAQPLPAPKDLPDLWEDEDPELRFEGDKVIQRDFAAFSDGNRAFALVAPDLDDGFHNLLRWFFPRVLLRHRGLLLHGAGVVRRGKGYVFFGHSGAGKSTVASLIRDADPEVQVLGDDSVIIRLDESGSPELHSAPLGCGYSREAPPAVSAPIEGIFALSQSERDEFERLPVSAGAAALLASAMSVSHDDAVEERLDLTSRFASSPKGVSLMRFRREPAFWREITRKEI